MKEEYKVPIWHKLNLSIEEAAAYSRIGENRLREELASENCTFCLRVGKKKKLIKRKEFEIWCQSMSEII